MSDEGGSPEPSPEYPLVVRSEAIPAQRSSSFLRPRELSLTSVVLASGIALALEGLRLVARTSRKRAATQERDAASAQITLTYEWMQVTYERYERS